MSGGEITLYILGVAIFLGAIFVSIALHELGHLYFAKKFGARVSQYMVGFGPTLASWTWRGTEYGIKVVPLGDYVKIIGMFPPSTDACTGMVLGCCAGPILPTSTSPNSCPWRTALASHCCRCRSYS